MDSLIIDNAITSLSDIQLRGKCICPVPAIPRLHVHVEYEIINYELYNFDGTSNREWVPFLYVGGGYSQPIGRHVWLTAQVLFDVLQDERSPYNRWDPVFSVGVAAGF